MEIEIPPTKIPDEEEKTFTTYNGNYEQNLEKYLNLFLKKEDQAQRAIKSPPHIRNPFPFKSAYLRKRKFEYYFVLRRNFKKIKGILHSFHSKTKIKEKILELNK
jgi:hypothetical protein